MPAGLLEPPAELWLRRQSLGSLAGICVYWLVTSWPHSVCGSCRHASPCRLGASDLRWEPTAWRNGQSRSVTKQWQTETASLPSPCTSCPHPPQEGPSFTLSKDSEVPQDTALPACTEVALSPAGQYGIQFIEHLVIFTCPPLSPFATSKSIQPTGSQPGLLPAPLPPASLHPATRNSFLPYSVPCLKLLCASSHPDVSVSRRRGWGGYPSPLTGIPPSTLPLPAALWMQPQPHPAACSSADLRGLAPAPRALHLLLDPGAGTFHLLSITAPPHPSRPGGRALSACGLPRSPALPPSPFPHDGLIPGYVSSFQRRIG